MMKLKELKRKISQLIVKTDDAAKPTIPQKRVDNTPQYRYLSGRGKEYFLKKGSSYPLRLTVGEAYQVLELRKRNYSIAKIHQSINWHHNTTESTIRTFLKGYEEGMFEEVFEEIQ